MEVSATPLPGVYRVDPRVFADQRGFFMETWQAARYAQAHIAGPFVQDNHSRSTYGTLRGLHYHRRQSDLWFVQQGRVTTVLLDTRIGSPTEGKHTTLQQGGGEELAVYIPEGVAHGFYAHDQVIMTYLVTGEYDGSDELGVAWNDPDLGIGWPDQEPVLSERDQRNPRLADVPADRRVPYSG